jgi:hypothetical protein
MADIFEWPKEDQESPPSPSSGVGTLLDYQ